MGFGFRAQASWLRALGLWCMALFRVEVLNLGFGVYGSGFRV